MVRRKCRGRHSQGRRTGRGRPYYGRLHRRVTSRPGVFLSSLLIDVEYRGHQGHEFGGQVGARVDPASAGQVIGDRQTRMYGDLGFSCAQSRMDRLEQMDPLGDVVALNPDQLGALAFVRVDVRAGEGDGELGG